MNVRETLEMLQSPAAEQLLARLYGPEHAEENRKRYRLTAEGRRVLEEEFDRLRRQVADGERVLRGEDAHEDA